MGQPMGFDAFSIYGKYGVEPLMDYLRIDQELTTRYLDMSEMESYPELSASLDIYSDEACLTADTEIPMLNGTVKTVGELYRERVRNGWVYGFNTKKAGVVACKFARVDKIAEKCCILKITYEDKAGKIGHLKVTPDHKFLAFNGQYVRAGDFKVGDKLMGLIKYRYQSHNKSYESVLMKPFQRIWKGTHRMVMETLGVMIPHGWFVHHKDHNGVNNAPLNLMPVSPEDHKKLHDKSGAKNPRFRHDVSWKKVKKVLKSGFVSIREMKAQFQCGARVLQRVVKDGGYRNWEALKRDHFGLKKNSYGKPHKPDTAKRYELKIREILEFAKANPTAPHMVFREKFGPVVDEVLKFFGYKGWNDFREKHRLPILKVAKLEETSNAANHTIISIEECPPEDVYDLVNSLPTHNFAAGNGGSWVFVKNTQPDVLTGRTIWIESDDDGIKKILQNLIDVNLQLDEEVWSIARMLAKFGNHFEEPLITQDGIIGLNALPPETMRRFEKGKGILSGYAQDPRGVFGITVNDVEEIIKGTQNPPSGMQVFEPWQITHFRLLSRARPAIYGTGVLEAARWIWRRLLLLEDAALIYRLTRTPTRWIFYIDVGKLPPSQALGHIRKIKNEFAKSKFVNERGCLTGETCVELLTGEIKTMRELADAGKDVWVYSYDLKRNKVVPAKARSPRKTAEKAEVWKVVLDNGAVVRCTPDHRFMMRNGEWSEAKDLKRGSSLMPFHIMRAGIGELPYPKIKHVGLGKWDFVHTLVAEELIDPKYREKGLLVHHTGQCMVPGHRDCSGQNCKMNNDPSALKLETFSEHSKDHEKGSRDARVLGFLQHVREDASFRWNLGRVMARNNQRWMHRIKGTRKQLMEILAAKVRSNPDWSLSEYADWMNKNEDVARLHKSIRKSAKTISRETLFQWIKRCGYDGTDEFKKDCLPKHQRKTLKIIKDRVGQIDLNDVQKACEGSFKISDVAKKLGVSWGSANKYMKKHAVRPEFSKVAVENHKVLWVGPDGFEDVYDITVDGYENFALTAGIFVHNSVDVRYNPLSSDENLFVPVVDGKRTTEVDLMATPEWQTTQDLEYFLNKLFSAIKIPRAYLSYGEQSRSRLLALEDVRFARTIMRLQREIRNGVRKLCKVHLAALGIDPEKVNFDVYMTVPSWAYELSQIEVRNAKAEFAEKVQHLISERAVTKAIFGFSDDEIDALRKERKEEQREAEENGAPEEEPPKRKKKAEGNSPMDLPGVSIFGPNEDKQVEYLKEQMDKLLKGNKILAAKMDSVKEFAGDMRSSMFFKTTSGRTKVVRSLGSPER
jgi:intein/homing endonuclease